MKSIQNESNKHQRTSKHINIKIELKASQINSTSKQKHIESHQIKSKHIEPIQKRNQNRIESNRI